MISQNIEVRRCDIFSVAQSSLWKCEPSLIDAKTLIENTTGIKTKTKKSLMTKIDNIFSEMNAIMDKIGKMGKVK